MTELQQSEIEALQDAGVVLKFASENVKDLANDISLNIENAWKAQQSNEWTPEIAGAFWKAYNQLLTAIKPANLDTIAATRKVVKGRHWFGGGDYERSIPQQSAIAYTILLLFLLVVTGFLGFISGTAKNYRDQALKLMEPVSQDLEKISLSLIQISQLAKGTDDIGPNNSKISSDARKVIAEMHSALQRVYFAMDQGYTKARFAYLLSMWSDIDQSEFVKKMHPGQTYVFGELGDVNSISGARDIVADLYKNRRLISLGPVQTDIVVNVISDVLLPILFGLLGSTAYIIRLISEQIKESTYSYTSPVRHRVRLALGALAGVAIGYSGVFVGNGISAATLSFIAGYAVEPVFATFDGIAEKFRKA
jgi:hypothetical protein